MSGTFHCDDPGHVGPSFVSRKEDRIIVSLDFMTQNGRERLRRVSADEAQTLDGDTVGPTRMCRQCANGWLTRMGKAGRDAEAQVLAGQIPLPLG